MVDDTRRWSAKAAYAVPRDGHASPGTWKALVERPFVSAERRGHALRLTIYLRTTIVREISCATTDVLALHDCIAVPDEGRALVVRFWSPAFVDAFGQLCEEKC